MNNEIEKIIKLYHKQFTALIDIGKEKNLNDEQINALQEAYFEALIKMFFKTVNIPRNKKLFIAKRILKDVSNNKI